MATIIAIDCGAKGCIVVQQGMNTIAHKMPTSVRNIYKLLEQYPSAIVFIEKIELLPMDVKGGRIYHSIELFKNYHQILAIIEILNIAYIELIPRTWQNIIQKRYNIGFANLEYNDRKKRLKDLCAELYRGSKVTLINCDALLILRVGKMLVTATDKTLRDICSSREKREEIKKLRAIYLQ